MIACKPLREYNRNQEKLKKICLEEKKRAQQKQRSLIAGPSSTKTPTPIGEPELYSHEQLVTNAKSNQKQQQQRRRTQQKRKAGTEKQQQKQQFSHQRRTKHTMHQKTQNPKKAAKEDKLRNQTNLSCRNLEPQPYNKQNSLWRNRQTKIDHFYI